MINIQISTKANRALQLNRQVNTQPLRAKMNAKIMRVKDNEEKLDACIVELISKKIKTRKEKKETLNY